VIKKIIARIRQLHKRKAFIFIALSSVSVAFALLLTMWASYRLDLIARSRQVTFTLSREESSVPILGTGINISEIPKTNLLEKSSFEPYVFRKVLPVIGGTDETIIVENKDAMPGTFGEGFFNGAFARINTYTGAESTTKKTGTIIRYSPNVAREFIKMPVEGDIESDSFSGAIARKEDRVIIAGSRGIVINNANTQSPDIGFAGISEDIVAATANSEEFFITTRSGELFSSPDGSSWSHWKSQPGVMINSIAASDNAVVATGDNGIILTGQNGIVYKRKLNTDGNILDIIHDGYKFVAISDLGEILISSNSLFWEIIYEDSEKKYNNICYFDSLYAIISDANEITIYNDIKSEYISRNVFEEEIMSLAILSKSKIFALGKSGDLYETSDYGKNWNKSLSSMPEGITHIYTAGDAKLISTSGFMNTYISELVTEIQLDSKLASGTQYFQAGDVCFISIEFSELPESLLDKSIKSGGSPWEIYGNGSAKIVMIEGAPSAGVGVMELSGDFSNSKENNFIAISQRIGYGNNSLKLVPGNFYNVSMWLRQESVRNNSVKVWISGSFDPIGIEFNNIGTTWKKYTFKFSFPPNITNIQAQSARINIGTEFENKIYLDEVTLNEVSEEDSFVKHHFKEMVSDINPGIIRNEYLKIGSLLTMPNRWAHNGSMDNALKFIWENTENASPWIVIDSAVSESELRNLIEYLFGSISTSYGKIRLNNGFPIPWINRFERIYLEFTDSKGIFSNDSVKSAYINNLIDIVQMAPNYSENRNKIIFVDGLYYDDGIMISRADYSATDLNISISSNLAYSIENSLNEYRSVIPRTPDRSAKIPYNILRSISFPDTTHSVSTAAYVSVMLDLLGSDCAASLITVSSLDEKLSDKSKLEAMKIVLTAAKGESIALDSTSEIEDEQLIRGYAFSNGDLTTLVFTSVSDTPSSIYLNISEATRGAQVTKIDSTGKNIEISKLKSAEKRLTILPGQVIKIILE